MELLKTKIVVKIMFFRPDQIDQRILDYFGKHQFYVGHDIDIESGFHIAFEQIANQIQQPDYRNYFRRQNKKMFCDRLGLSYILVLNANANFRSPLFFDKKFHTHLKNECNLTFSKEKARTFVHLQ